MKSSDHPKSCTVCHGTGWEPAGHHRAHGHSTYRPCQHHWFDDDPHDDPIPWADPRAQRAFERGLAQGRADLRAMRHEPATPVQPEQPELALNEGANP